MLASALSGMRVYRMPPEDKRVRQDGSERDPKKIGKIHYPVFSPDGRRVVGYLVKQPDVVGMIKQPDLFVALDALDVVGENLVVGSARDACGPAAVKRLGLDLDACLVWTGMDVRTRSGKKLGYCSDANFNTKTGRVSTFSFTASGAATALLGVTEMPAEFMRGYHEGYMVVDDAAAELGLSGGAAARAAEMSVQAKAAARRGARALDEKGSVAVDAGSRALGKQLGRAKGMFAGFASEYKKAAGTGSTKKKGSSAAKGAGKKAAGGTGKAAGAAKAAKAARKSS